nr:MAG TPA: hypothetical protein [Caudoviricetes sp.]
MIFWKIFVIIYLQGKERHQVYKIKKIKKRLDKLLHLCYN